MWDFVKSVIIKAIVDALFSIGKIVIGPRPKEAELSELGEKLQNGDLTIGDSVRLVGAYSELVPFLSMGRIALLTKKSETLPLPVCSPCKVDPIEDEYVGALLEEDQFGIFSGTRCIPIFYSRKYSKNSIRMANFTTGEIVELQGAISPLPTAWKEMITASDFFCFDRPDGSSQPFCLKVDDVEPYGTRLDGFYCDLWSLVHFEASVPQTNTRQLLFIEAATPPEIVIESIFPGCFQFTRPLSNIMDVEQIKKDKAILAEYVGNFPSTYFQSLNITDFPKERGGAERQRQARYVRDACFDNFSPRPISSRRLSRRYFKDLDRLQRKAFGPVPLRIVYEQLIRDPDKKSRELARRYPKVLGNPILVGYENEALFRGKRLFPELEKYEKYRRRLLKLPILGSLKMIGHYIARYGIARDGFTEDEYSQLMQEVVSSPYSVPAKFAADLLALTAEGHLKLRLDEHGEIIFSLTDRGIAHSGALPPKQWKTPKQGSKSKTQP
jgi:hypothetical protein